MYFNTLTPLQFVLNFLEPGSLLNPLLIPTIPCLSQTLPRSVECGRAFAPPNERWETALRCPEVARRAEPRPLPRRRWGPAGSWDVDPASSVCPSRPCHCVPGSWGFLVPARRLRGKGASARVGRCGSRHLESAVGSGGTGRTGRRERRGKHGDAPPRALRPFSLPRVSPSAPRARGFRCALLASVSRRFGVASPPAPGGDARGGRGARAARHPLVPRAPWRRWFAPRFAAPPLRLGHGVLGFRFCLLGDTAKSRPVFFLLSRSLRLLAVFQFIFCKSLLLLWKVDSEGKEATTGDQLRVASGGRLGEGVARGGRGAAARGSSACRRAPSARPAFVNGRVAGARAGARRWVQRGEPRECHPRLSGTVLSDWKDT